MNRNQSQIRDSLMFTVMSILIFLTFSLSFTSVTGSSGAGIRYLHLHWIVVRQDVGETSVSHIFGGALIALIAVSLGLTSVLSKVLKVLHNKKNDKAWMLFVFVVVIYVLIACQQGFALT